MGGRAGCVPDLQTAHTAPLPPLLPPHPPPPPQCLFFRDPAQQEPARPIPASRVSHLLPAVFQASQPPPPCCGCGVNRAPHPHPLPVHPPAAQERVVRVYSKVNDDRVMAALQARSMMGGLSTHALLLQHATPSLARLLPAGRLPAVGAGALRRARAAGARRRLAPLL